MSPLHRIQSRLFGSYLLIILLSLGSVYVAIRASVERHFDEHERLLENLEMTRMVHWLTGYHNIHDGWEGLQPYVDEMSVLFGNRIVVVGDDGAIVADSRTDSSEPNLSRTWPSRPLQYSPEDRSVGTLYVGSELTIQETFRTRLEGSIRSFLVLGFAVAVGAAVVLSAAAARRLASPVRLLAESAARAGAGDLTVRVDVAERGELGLLAHAFNTMVEELQRATTARRNLVADTAHEL